MPENSSSDRWPRRVLLTNDDGIDDPGLIALARAFAPLAETHVVAPLEDRSQCTHFFLAETAGRLTVERRELGDGIQAHAVDGYPADCVLLAFGGLMDATPPDLVISGINDNPNLAASWLDSGTIGAARMAAFLGWPALAVSGYDPAISGAPAAAARRVVELVRTPWVRGLTPGNYLTMSIPCRPDAEIRGIRLARRAGLLADFWFERQAVDEGGRAVWSTHIEEHLERAPAGSDAELFTRGYVVVSPMRADEHDDELLARMKGLLPA